MERARWLLFWASVVVTVFGAVSRFAPQPLIDGIAAGTYWKGGLTLVAYSIALSLMRSEKLGA